MDYVPPSSGGAPTPLDSGDKPVQPPQGGLAGKSQVIPLASQDFRGNANRMNLSPRVQPSLRLCNQVSSPQRGATSVLNHLKALHQDRLHRGAPSKDHGRPLSTFSPVQKKGRKVQTKYARMYRSSQAELAYLVRALQDGGAAHHLADPNERPHYEGRALRLLHVLPYRKSRR